MGCQRGHGYLEAFQKEALLLPTSKSGQKEKNLKSHPMETLLLVKSYRKRDINE
jgi:hypothetical protein